MTQEIEERLRVILNSKITPRTDYRGVVLPNKEWFHQLEQQKNHFNDFKYLLLSTEQIEDTTGDFVIFHPTFKNPHSIMLNEWIIYFPITPDSTEDIFHLLGEHNQNDFANFDSHLVKVIQITNEKWNSIRKQLVQTLKDQKIKNMRIHFTMNYMQRFGYIPPRQVIDSLILDFIEKLDGDK